MMDRCFTKVRAYHDATQTIAMADHVERIMTYRVHVPHPDDYARIKSAYPVGTLVSIEASRSPKGAPVAMTLLAIKSGSAN